MRQNLKMISDEQLIEICKKCSSFSQVSTILGYKGGSGYAAVRDRIVKANIDTTHFTGRAWNRGLTKNEHTSIAKFANSISQKQRGTIGHCQSIETRKRLSNSRIQFLETHNNHGLKWYDVPCGNTVKRVQGTWEKNVALWLNENNVTWDRKTVVFATHRKYTPDFYLPKYDFFIEVKGYWRDRDVYKMFLVLDDNNIDIRYIDKTNITNLSLDLPKFIDRFDRNNIDMTKFVDVWNVSTSIAQLAEASHLG